MKNCKTIQRSLNALRQAIRRSTLSRTFNAASTLFVLVALVLATLINPFATAGAVGVPNSIIVELTGDSAAVWKARQENAGRSVSDDELQNYRNALRADQELFLASLQQRGIGYEIDGVNVKNFDGSDAGRVEFRNTLVLNAVTLRVPASAINTIKALPQVKRVEPNRDLKLLLDNSVPYINAPGVYGQVPELTADDNHREGFEGQGINIAVLDTGIDWSHEMFGGDPTPPRHGLAPSVAAFNTNKKVIYYLPFTGVIDDFGHGTHASADAAGYLGFAPGADLLPGTADDVRLFGVAPQARLMGYKICSAAGTCPTAATNLAIEDAVSPRTLTLQPKPVAHVINLSLGGPGGPDDSSATAASNAALLGTVVVASAGNEGPGEGTVGSPSAGRHVISVAATTHPGAGTSNWSIDVLQSSAVGQNQIGVVTPARNLQAQAGFDRLKLFPMVGTPSPAAGSIAQRYALVNLFNLTDTYPTSARGRIALVKDAGLVSASFADICNNAALNGAVGMVLISTTTSPTAVNGPIPCAAISPTDGEVLVDAISASDDNAIDPANGTVSQFPIRVNPFLSPNFVGETADFSSRGPVAGFGQVKPDVTAPGVAIYAATSPVGAPVVSMMDPSRYIAANGTSFSGPQVAGATALIKQAHLNWSPDIIRAALINTATNLRTGTGVPKADGSTADSINEQGGGLVDVTAAVNAKALMGVTGDGIIEPAILASHSFGENAILNNRIVNTREVTVTLRDVSGQGGTYNLSTSNNRLTNIEGVTTSVSPAAVNVPANGSTTFTARISIDGDKVRDTAIKQFQWYIVANRAGSTDKLRMPLYLRATPSLPSDDVSSAQTETFTGTVPAGDGGVQRDQNLYLAEGATYVDVPFTVTPAGLKIDATLSWDFTEAPAGGVGLPDLDFLLFDPNGNEIGNSGNGSGPERITADVTTPGTYIYRVYGFANAATNFEIQSTQLLGAAPPVVQPFASDFAFEGQRFDYDGNYNVTWQPQGSALSYEVEESVNGASFAVVRTVTGNVTSAAFNSVPNGTRSYRIRSISNGRIGKYVTIPSNVESIVVARRVDSDVTPLVNVVNKSIAFPAGSTELVSALRNTSNTIVYPATRLEIVSVQSTGNSVRVANADNGGNGVSQPAVFDYSQLVGADLAANEESGVRTIRFNNPNTVLFTITVKVRGHLATAAASSSNTASANGAPGETTNANNSSSTDSGLNSVKSALPNETTLLRFTINPLTNQVTPQLSN